MKKKQQRKETSGNLMKITDGKLTVKEQETTKQQKGLEHQDIQVGTQQAESEEKLCKGKCVSAGKGARGF